MVYSSRAVLCLNPWIYTAVQETYVCTYVRILQQSHTLSRIHYNGTPKLRTPRKSVLIIERRPDFIHWDKNKVSWLNKMSWFHGVHIKWLHCAHIINSGYGSYICNQGLMFLMPFKVYQRTCCSIIQNLSLILETENILRCCACSVRTAFLYLKPCQQITLVVVLQEFAS